MCCRHILKTASALSQPGHLASTKYHINDEILKYIKTFTSIYYDIINLLFDY